ncbi:MAG: T9SS type A sorting domain-containing protein [Bacteroidales bacterium]|nr:T9SS type A sorting domain-containing protein [Bacteroidales bacterium]
MKIAISLLFVIQVVVFNNGYGNNSLELNARADTVWGKVGSEWHYNYNFAQIPGPGGSTFTWFKSLKDTLVNGQTCQIILEKRNYNCIGEPYIHELHHLMYTDNGRVYEVRDAEQFLLYDFNKNTGEYWILDGYENDTVYVDSTSTIPLLNGQNRKVLYVSKTNNFDNSYRFSGMMIEGIGSEEYLFPFQETLPCQDGGTLRCYQENSTLLISHFSPCDFETVGIEDVKIEKGLVYMPTLVTDILTIHVSDEINMHDISIMIINSASQLLLHNQGINEKSMEINVSHLPKGMYIVLLQSKNQFIKSKFLKI